MSAVPAGLAALLAQLALMVALAPLCGWGIAELPRWIGGEAVAGPGVRYRAALRFWRRVGQRAGRGKMEPDAGLALAAALVALASLPGISEADPLLPLADPLMIGFMLLGARDVFMGTARDERSQTVRAGLVLCLAEALIALAAPGADGFGGLRAMDRIAPVPGLEGALAACALALAIACPPIGESAVAGPPAGNREARETRRGAAEMLNLAWVLLLADLAFPGGRVDAPALAFRLIAVIGFLAAMRLAARERSARLTAVLCGAALLLALSGRLPA